MDGTTGSLPQALLAHAGWARRLARQLVSESQADDLVQDALVAGLRHPPTHDRPLRGWLATVMRNLAVNRATADRRRQAREHLAENAPAAPTAEEALATVQLHRQLARLVERLPADDRRIVVLHFFEERTSAQIGQLLGVPAATVRWRLRRALVQLRTWLDEESGGERRLWVVALAPLLRPVTAPLRAGLGLIGGAGLLVGAAGIVAIVATSTRRPAATTAAVPAASPVAAAGAPASAGPITRQAAAATTGHRCREEMARARAEFVALERDLQRYEDHATYFDKAAPRPDQDARWAPLVAELLTPEAGGVLECREGICRILFVAHPDAPSPVPDGPWLSRVYPLVAHIGAATVGGITRDPLTGELQQKHARYLRLVRQPPPVPADPDACARAHARLAEELIGLHERQERALPPPVVFQRTRETNQVATNQLRAWLRAQAGSRVHALAIECRGPICRLESAPSWLQKLPEWSQRAGGGYRGDDGAIYHRMRSPRPPTEEETAREHYMKQVAAVVQPAIKRCADQHTQADRVDLEILWPAPGELNADGVEGRPSVRTRGPDGQLSLGRCLGPMVSAALATLPQRPGPGPANSWFKVVGTRPPP